MVLCVIFKNILIIINNNAINTSTVNEHRIKTQHVSVKQQKL